MPVWLSTAIVVIVAFLCWNLFRRSGVNSITALREKPRPASRFAKRRMK